MERDLADDVRGGTEPVQAQPRRVARHRERPVSDQPGAQERGGLEIRIPLGHRERVALVGDRVLRVPAVDVVARETRSVAQVLAPGEAVAALAVCPSEPRDPHAVALRVALRALAAAGNASHDLVPGHERQLGLGQLPVDHMEIGAAYAADVDVHEDLARPRFGLRDIRRT